MHASGTEAIIGERERRPLRIVGIPFMSRGESRFQLKLPKLSEPLKTFSAWLQLAAAVGALISLCAAVAVFLASRFSPDFISEYKDMDFVPLSAIKRSFGLSSNPIGNDAQLRLLRISVKNNKSSAGAQDVKVIVADYIQTLTFVMEENGDPIQKYTLTPSGNTSRLEVPIGYLPPRSEHVLFIGGRCLLIDFADIHAESSNVGISDSSEIGELSGIRLFVGTNAEWISITFLLILSAILLANARKKAR